MTIQEYESSLTRIEGKIARVSELQALIKFRNNEMSEDEAAQFVFNKSGVLSPRPFESAEAQTTTVIPGQDPVDVTVAGRPVEQPTFGLDDSVDAIFAQVKAELNRGQGGDVPASSTKAQVSDLSQINNIQPTLVEGGGTPVGKQVDNAIRAGAAGLAESVTLGAITLSERDQKLIAQSPLAYMVGGLIGDIAPIGGALKGAKMTAQAFKAIVPALLKAEGGEKVAGVLLKAAAREGMAGAYYDAAHQLVAAIKDPDEKKTLEERLTSLALHAGIFAAVGAGVSTYGMIKNVAKGLPAVSPKVVERVRGPEEAHGYMGVKDVGAVQGEIDRAVAKLKAKGIAVTPENVFAVADKGLLDVARESDDITRQVRALIQQRTGKAVTPEMLNATQDAPTKVVNLPEPKPVSPRANRFREKVAIPEETDAVVEQISKLEDAQLRDELLDMGVLKGNEIAAMDRNELLYRVSGGRLGTLDKIKKAPAKAAEVPSSEQLQELQSKGQPLDKTMDAAKAPPVKQSTPVDKIAKAAEEPTIEMDSGTFTAKKYDYAAHIGEDGKTVIGQVVSDINEAGMVTLKPRRGAVVEVPAKGLRNPADVPREAPQDMGKFIEGAENQRRIREEKKVVPDEVIDELVDDTSPVGGPAVGTKPIKPLAQAAKDNLDKIATKHMQSAKATWEGFTGDKLFDVTSVVPATVSLAKDLTVVGAAKIAKGAIEFAEWSAEMVSEFGDKIKPHLEELYKRSKDEFHKLRADTGVEQHADYVKQIQVAPEYRPPQMERANELKQGLRESLTGRKTRGAQLKQEFIKNEYDEFVADAWASGAPLTEAADGTMIPVFDSPDKAKALYDRIRKQAMAKYGAAPKLTTAQESEITKQARILYLREVDRLGVGMKLKQNGRVSTNVKRDPELNLYVVLKNQLGDRLKGMLKDVAEADRYEVMLDIAKQEGLIVPHVRQSGVFLPIEMVTNVKKFLNASEGIGSAKLGLDANLGGTKRIDYLIREADGKLTEIERAALPGQAGSLERNVLWRTHDMMKQKMAWLSDMGTAAKQAIDGITNHEGNTITDLLEMISSKDANMTAAGIKGIPGVTELLTQELSNPARIDKVIDAVVKVRQIYDTVLDQMNLLRRQRGQPEIPKRQFYSPHSPEELSLFDELMGKGSTEAAAGGTLPDTMVRNKPFVGFDLRRLMVEAEIPLERNTKKLLERYLNLASRDIFDTSIIQNNKTFVDFLSQHGLDAPADAIARWTSQSFAGGRHALDDVFGVGHRAAHWMSAVRGGIIRSSFPFNLAWTTGIQTSAVVPMAAIYGVQNTGKGLLRWVNDKGFRQEVKDNVYAFIIKSNDSGKISHQDFNQGMSRAIKLAKSAFDTAADVGSYFSEQVEQFLSGWAAASAYERGLQLGLKGKAMQEYMSEGIAKTAGMFNKEDVAGVVRSEIFKTAIPFQSFSFEFMNVMREWAGRTGTPPATANERIRQFVTFVAGATALNFGQGYLTGRKPWELQSFIPAYSALLDPENKKSPFMPQQLVSDATTAVRKAVEGEWDPLIKYMLRYGTAAVKIPGGAQWARMYDGIQAIANEGKLDSRGKMMFPITSTKDKIYSALWGPWSTKGGQEKVRDMGGGIDFAPQSDVIERAVESIPVVGDVIEFAEPKGDRDVIRESYDEFQKQLTGNKEKQLRSQMKEFIQAGGEWENLRGSLKSREMSQEQIDTAARIYRETMRMPGVSKAQQAAIATRLKELRDEKAEKLNK